MVYVVTGLVKKTGKRDVISTRFLTKNRAESFMKKLKIDLRNSIPKYKWVMNLRVEKK